MIKKLLFITLLGISFLAGSVFAAQLPQVSSECHMWYQFDETSQTSGFTDSCSNEDDFESASDSRAGGVFGYGRDNPTRLLNDDSLDIHYTTNPDTNLTVGGWFRTDLTNGGGMFHWTDNCPNSFGSNIICNAYTVSLNETGGIEFKTNRFGSGTRIQLASNDGVITDELFHHIVLVYSDDNTADAISTSRILVDGVDVTDTSSYNTFNSGDVSAIYTVSDPRNFYIGQYCPNMEPLGSAGAPCGGDEKYALQYDDFFWLTTTNISNSDIRNIYNAGVGRKYLELSTGIDDAINLTEGLEFYIDMDGVSASTQNDVTNNGHTVTLTNSPSQVQGVINNARDFDGSTMYGAPNNVSVQSSNPSTYTTGLGPSSTFHAFQFWAYPNTPSSQDSLFGAYRPAQSSNNAIGVQAFQCRNSEWNLFYRWEYGTGTLGDIGPDCDANTYQHLIWSNDGFSLRLYKDGVLATSWSTDDEPSWGVNPPYFSICDGSNQEIPYGIGTNLNCDSSAHYDYFDGSIDEIGHWTSSTDLLNHHEVQCLYNDGLGYSYTAITGTPDCSGTGTGGNGTTTSNGIVSNTGNIYFWNVGYPENITGDITYNSVTKIIDYTWNDTTGGATEGVLELYIKNGTQKQLLTTTTGGTSSGTITFNYTDYTDYGFIANGFIDDDSRTYVTNGLIWVDTLSRGITPLNPDDFGNDGLFWSAILIGTLMLFGIWNPPVALGLGLFGVYITSTLGIINLGATALWSIVLIAIIIMWRIRA